MQDATPLMQQYFTIKAQHPDTILMFQVGDFYELFFDDAKTAAAALGIALTARGKNKGEPIPLCGVPVHALDHYLTKLVKSGFKVAICEQLEPPVPGRVVERGVTQVLTPGTLTDAKLLDEKSASYLFSFFPTTDSWGLLFGEILTAQLYATVLPASADRTLESELIRFFPDEILIPPSSLGKTYQGFFKSRGYFTTMVNQEAGENQEFDAWMVRNLRGASVQKIYEQEALKRAVSLFHAYVAKNQQSALEQFKSIQFYQPEDFLLLDPSTQRNLELIKSSQDGSRKNTLFAVMDRATTAMGSRVVKKWLLRPLIKKEMITARQDTVQLLLQDAGISQKLEQLLAQVGDIERVVGRIGLLRANLHDYVMLSQALEVIPHIVQILNSRKRVQLIEAILQSIADFSLLHSLLVASLNDDNSKPWTIKPGFDLQLDRLRELVENANQKILELETQEQEKTGIQSLKIRFNQAHGYYIEITKANLDSVPDYYTRHQTLVGRERFTIPALRDLQQEIFSAKGHIDQVEAAVFSRIKGEVVSHISQLRKLAYALSNLDALLGLSKLAYENGYVRPQFNTERTISIDAGRHPVVAHLIGNNFIPNDTKLDDNESVWIITGPNMGGKSTYLRQVALINIMAQCGSFVPAQAANLHILDRIFTRIGAGDNVSEGKSTFLVEMEETASICSQATKNSLVILDEVGRGTSTFDGLAIAQSVVEYIATKVQARCLFATHYHELTLLQDQIQGIASYYAASTKRPDGILFLYKILRGVADGSFGVEVAKLAQLPDAVIMRAEQILTVLGATELQHSNALKQLPSAQSSDPLMERYELLMRENKSLKNEYAAITQKVKEQDEILRALGSLDYDNLSPKQAFDLLWKLKQG
jgi:DNA mismatch repair protein MutS